MQDYKTKASFYLEKSDLYNLDLLPTESPHPKTNKLSHLANSDLKEAINIFKNIDLNALNVLEENLSSIEEMAKQVSKCIESGGRIFICGCGATGRLALNTEYLFNQKFPMFKDKIISFMAGGDIALIHSLENFEDFPEYGADHLMQLGFNKNDLFISSSEGGETPYVIGALEKAAVVTKHKAYFLFCNPKKSLSHIKRSQDVFNNLRIESICLSGGPMALSGSTRLQASTVLMSAIALAVLNYNSIKEIKNNFKNLITDYKKLNCNLLIPFIESESQCYSKDQSVIYKTDAQVAIAVFTDTTERSPTFNLEPFEHTEEESVFSNCYISINGAQSKESVWPLLLGRKERNLNWKERSNKTLDVYLNKFDFSKSVLTNRQTKTNKQQNIFSIEYNANSISWGFGENNIQLNTPNCNLLGQHLILKMCLNMHSTLLMGRLNRYYDNLMTWVKPTNGKLINRTAKYIDYLLVHKSNKQVPYNDIIHCIFKHLKDLDSSKSIVLTCYYELKKI